MTDIALSPPDELFQLDTDTWTAPYWDAAKERRLTALRCTDCGRFRMVPAPFCPHCRSQAHDWPTLSGKGVVYSFCIVNVPIVKQMQGHTPYVPAVVSLPDAPGIRLMTNIVDCPVGEIAIDKEVNVVWHERDDGVVIPRFTLASPQ